MKRRTPVRELQAEENAEALLRRSSRIAQNSPIPTKITQRRSSSSSDTSTKTPKGRRLSLSQENNSDSTESKASSGTNATSTPKKTRLTRSASKSPTSLAKDLETKAIPTRTRRGSLTKSVDEENTHTQTPSQKGKGRSTRSESKSPITVKDVEPAKTRTRRGSITEKIIPLQKIEEIHSTPEPKKRVKSRRSSLTEMSQLDVIEETNVNKVEIKKPDLESINEAKENDEKEKSIVSDSPESKEKIKTENCDSKEDKFKLSPVVVIHKSKTISDLTAIQNSEKENTVKVVEAKAALINKYKTEEKIKGDIKIDGEKLSSKTVPEQDKMENITSNENYDIGKEKSISEENLKTEEESTVISSNSESLKSLGDANKKIESDSKENAEKSEILTDSKEDDEKSEKRNQIKETVIDSSSETQEKITSLDILPNDKKEINKLDTPNLNEKEQCSSVKKFTPEDEIILKDIDSVLDTSQSEVNDILKANASEVEKSESLIDNASETIQKSEDLNINLKTKKSSIPTSISQSETVQLTPINDNVQKESPQTPVKEKLVNSETIEKEDSSKSNIETSEDSLSEDKSLDTNVKKLEINILESNSQKETGQSTPINDNNVPLNVSGKELTPSEKLDKGKTSTSKTTSQEDICNKSLSNLLLNQVEIISGSDGSFQLDLSLQNIQDLSSQEDVGEYKQSNEKSLNEPENMLNKNGSFNKENEISDQNKDDTPKSISVDERDTSLANISLKEIEKDPKVLEKHIQDSLCEPMDVDDPSLLHIDDIISTSKRRSLNIEEEYSSPSKKICKPSENSPVIKSVSILDNQENIGISEEVHAVSDTKLKTNETTAVGEIEKISNEYDTSQENLNVSEDVSLDLNNKESKQPECNKLKQADELNQINLVKANVIETELSTVESSDMENITTDTQSQQQKTMNDTTENIQNVQDVNDLPNESESVDTKENEKECISPAFSINSADLSDDNDDGDTVKTDLKKLSTEKQTTEPSIEAESTSPECKSIISVDNETNTQTEVVVVEKHIVEDTISAVKIYPFTEENISSNINVSIDENISSNIDVSAVENISCNIDVSVDENISSNIGVAIDENISGNINVSIDIEKHSNKIVEKEIKATREVSEEETENSTVDKPKNILSVDVEIEKEKLKETRIRDESNLNAQPGNETNSSDTPTVEEHTEISNPTLNENNAINDSLNKLEIYPELKDEVSLEIDVTSRKSIGEKDINDKSTEQVSSTTSSKTKSKKSKKDKISKTIQNTETSFNKSDEMDDSLNEDVDKNSISNEDSKSQIESNENPSSKNDTKSSVTQLIGEISSDEDQKKNSTDTYSREKGTKLTKSKSKKETKINTEQAMPVEDSTEQNNSKDVNIPLKDRKKKSLQSKSYSDSDFLLDENVESFIEETMKELVSSSEDENNEKQTGNEFIDDMAEEGEEDTPSEGSNDIPCDGESINSSDTYTEEDDNSYEADSFIDDDEDKHELLSGEENFLQGELIDDLKNVKTKRKSISPQKEKKKLQRIITVSDSDEEQIPTNIDTIDVVESNKKTQEEDTQLANEINITDENNEIKTKDSSEDNICSNENIDDIPADLLPSKNDVIHVYSDSDNNESVCTERNDVRNNKGDVVENSSNRKSSITIQENIKLEDVEDGELSERISKVVDWFYTGIRNNSETGSISLNVSLDYADLPTNEENLIKSTDSNVKLEDRNVDINKESKKRKSDDYLTNESPKKTAREKVVEEIFTVSNDDTKDYIKLPKSKSSKKLKRKTSQKENQIHNESNDEIISSEKKIVPEKTRKKHSNKLAVLENLNDQLKPDTKIGSKRLSDDKINYLSPKKIKCSTGKERKSNKAATGEGISNVIKDITSTLNKKKKNKSEEYDDEVFIENDVETNVKSDKLKKLKKNKKIDQVLDGDDKYMKTVNVVKSNDLPDSKKKKTRKTKVSSLLVADNEKTKDDDFQGMSNKKIDKLALFSSEVKELNNEFNIEVEDKKSRKQKRLSFPTKKADIPCSSGLLRQQFISKAIASKCEVAQKKEKKRKLKQKVSQRILPSKTTNLDDSWESEIFNMNLLPSKSNRKQNDATSKKKKKTEIDSFSSKDFKNKMLYDSNRIKRMATKVLLKQRKGM